MGRNWTRRFAASTRRRRPRCPFSAVELGFDFLVPWGSEEGQPYGYGVTRTEALENLQRIIERLRNGGYW